MDAVTLRQYETLSPFEIKNDLAKVAAKTAKASQAAYLNAGRGNPNWVATEPRSAFFLLGQFAVTESQRTMQLSGGLGGMAKAPGIAARLASWLEAHPEMPGAALLRSVIPWAVSTFGFSADDFVHELVDSILGDNYPVPDRMLVHNERIVREYLQWAMCGDPRPAGTFDLYAVEGGTAAMCYIFKSLKANRLLNPGDTIAMVTPIFTPYLEMPHLEDYGLHMTFIQARQEQRWQFTDKDFAPLLDPKVKAFFVVNPGNPYAVALSRESIAAIGRVLEKRPDFMLLTDDVYGTFVPGFRSLLGEFPRNTLGVYSYSKYFGCSGWRLGVIALHEKNVFDAAIAALPDKVLEGARQALRAADAPTAGAEVHRPDRRRQQGHRAQSHRRAVAAAAGDDDALLARGAPRSEEGVPAGVHQSPADAGDGHDRRSRASRFRPTRSSTGTMA